MNPCPSNDQLNAFHDGRIVGDQRVSIERHIAQCLPCTREIARLSALSNLLASLPRPHLSQIARRRMHDRLDAAMERGLIRFGWSLSGIAASILVIGSAWLMQTHGTETLQSTPPWVAVAKSNSATDSDSAASRATTPVGQWYLADASSSMSDTP